MRACECWAVRCNLSAQSATWQEGERDVKGRILYLPIGKEPRD